MSHWKRSARRLASAFARGPRMPASAKQHSSVSSLSRIVFGINTVIKKFRVSSFEFRVENLSNEFVFQPKHHRPLKPALAHCRTVLQSVIGPHCVLDLRKSGTRLIR